MHITYLPTIVCPSCGRESEWTELENSARLLEGIECPRCEAVAPITQYRLNPKWQCSVCNSEVFLSDCVGYGDGKYVCSNCGCKGIVVSEIMKFERARRYNETWYLCPYCKTDIPASDLVPDGKGEIIFCPVCGKAAEI